MNTQAEAWAGEFGDRYAARSPGSVEANIEFFKRALPAREWSGRGEIKTVIEFGAGVGSNLEALHRLMPDTILSGVEINAESARQASYWAGMTTGSMLDWDATIPYDLSMTKGVLIHIPPADLPRAYTVLYESSCRYILIAEYYAPKSTMIPYRGKDDMLWKRDFAGEMMDKYPDLKLSDYGFVYHRDPYPQDDLNWFLLQKT